MKSWPSAAIAVCKSAPSARAFRTAAGATWRSMLCTLSGCAAVCSWMTYSACEAAPNNLARSARSFANWRSTDLLSFWLSRFPLISEASMMRWRNWRFWSEASTGLPEKLTIPIIHLPISPRSAAALAAAAISFSLSPSNCARSSTTTARSLVSASTFFEN